MVELITATVSPALDHIIERPRLIARLEEGGGSRVAVFAAPAGYGKTTLARQWSERQSGPVAWYRTTRASGDVALLAVQLDELLASIAPELPREPAKVASIASVNPSPKPLGRAIVRTFEPLTQDVLLIVDEWEAAETPEAEELLAMLVDGLDIRFLITTRERPDWFAPRLEVYGDGLEIGIDELAMTDEEAADVLFYLRNKDAREEVAAIAGGWPAVLGLAAMNARAGRTEQKGLVPDTLYEYLAAELIDAADGHVQHALTVLAVTGATALDAARILLNRDADDLLIRAQERGLIMVDRQRRITMHPLLRHMLIERARHSSEPLGPLREILDRILTHRLWDEGDAIIQALPDGDFIASLIAAALPDLLRRGRLMSVRDWIQAGRQAGARSALLDYSEAELALREGELLQAYGFGVQAANALEGDLAARAHLVAARAAHLTDRPVPTREHAQLAERLADTPETREGAAWLRFLASVESQADDARELLDEYNGVARAGVDQTLTAATGELAYAQLHGGLFDALDVAEVALSLARDAVDPICHTSLLNTYSYHLVLAARYEESISAAEELTRVAQVYELEFPLRYASFAKAAGLIGCRRFAAADRLLSSLEKQTGAVPGTFFAGNVAIQRARLFASVGDLRRARDVLALGPVEGASISARGEFLAMQALVHAASSQFDLSSELTAEARRVSSGLETRALGLMAEAVATLHEDDEGADRQISAAIATQAWDPIVIAVRAAPLLAQFMTQSELRRTWLQRLLISSSDTSLAASLGLKVPRSAKPKQRLSPREQEVHELLAQGRTNEEIARLLYISLSTTKVHVKHIFEKLGVHSRVEAARAWEGSDASQ